MLAGCRDEQRLTERAKFTQSPQHLEILVVRLTECNPRVDDDRRVVYTGRPSVDNAIAQELEMLGDEVTVDRWGCRPHLRLLSGEVHDERRFAPGRLARDAI